MLVFAMQQPCMQRRWPATITSVIEPTQYAFAEQIRLTASAGHDPGEIYSSWKVTGHQPRHKKHLGIAKSTEGARTTT